MARGALRHPLSMDHDQTEESLVARAKAGEEVAFRLLVVECHDRLVAWIAQEIPTVLQSVIEAQDVAQEAYARASKDMERFRPQGDGSFYRWLSTLARNSLRDMLKREWTQKRGGGSVRVTPQDGSVDQLLEMLAASQKTPSRVVAGQEGVAAVRQAMAELKDEYRQAIQLICIDKWPVTEAAAKLNVSKAAVLMRCHRGKEEMRLALGGSSAYLTKKE